ncbi:MAG: hypothetical protein IPM92_02250 [Saprospiraceae bacterium]|nr:hypothetical protein [Saprospiraceae bacterium]
MIADLGITAASLGNSLFKTYKSLSELKTFLTNNNSLFNAIFETIDELKLVDALEWIKSGATKQFRVILGNNSIDDLLNKLALKFGKNWKDFSWGKMIDNIPGVIIKYYPMDSSFNSPAIEIIVNGISFKIRIQI